MSTEREQGAAAFSRIKALRDGTKRPAANSNVPQQRNVTGAKGTLQAQIDTLAAEQMAGHPTPSAPLPSGSDRENGAAAAARLKALRN